MDIETLIYSLDQKVTISELKNKTYNQNIDTTKLQQRMSQNTIFALKDGTDQYHYKLATIKAHPYIVYGKGNIKVLDKPILGIVGPRKMTTYAEQVLIKLFEKLPHYECVTLSGLADGVDSMCHALSIKNNIPTIAILGGGLAYFLQTPKRHLIDDIVNHNGLVLSEFKLKQKPTIYTFPQRNRIIAGLADVLFVPEASEGSGSLITINDALAMHKHVYGAPNTIFSSSSLGLLQMISAGKVKCVAGFDSFLCTHFKKKTAESAHPSSYNLNLQQINIIKTLTDGPCSIENLLEKTSIPLTDLQTHLAMLEILGIVGQIHPGIYALKQNENFLS